VETNADDNARKEDPIQQLVKEAKELIHMLEKTSVRRVNLQTETFKIEVERAFAKKGSATAAQATWPPDAAGEAVKAASGTHQVLSPLVGVFYRSPKPGAKPFIDVGSRVMRGEVICIVEAMKVMSEVPSDASGLVVEILVKDGEAVQYGQPLLVIDVTA
jgi:acetyl-CoA carboxylase biotin carboxyl carrier protein